MSLDVNFPKDMDPIVQSYLQGPVMNTVKGITEAKIQGIIQNRPPKDLQKPEIVGKIERLVSAFKRTHPNYESMAVSVHEAESFQKKLGTKDQPGVIGKFIYDEEGEFVECAKEDGKLFGGEIDGIRIYTSENYLLMNGTLDEDDTSIREWLQYRPEVSIDDDLLDIQSHVPQIVKFAVSGLNKLPPYEGMIYRGDAITPRELESWRNGDKQFMYTFKFCSYSIRVDVAEAFAKINAESYINDKAEEYRPVLYAIQSESSKDISGYSLKPDEGERVYAPGQAFRLVDVDEGSVPGLAIIFLKEME